MKYGCLTVHRIIMTVYSLAGEGQACPIAIEAIFNHNMTYFFMSGFTGNYPCSSNFIKL